jgi:hypothetical protein
MQSSRIAMFIKFIKGRPELGLQRHAPNPGLNARDQIAQLTRASAEGGKAQHDKRKSRHDLRKIKCDI